MRFIFLTKTDWAEPPRLRHQLARLLAGAGYDVCFIQRPLYPWQNTANEDSGENRISLYRSHQLIHHKLRVHPLLHRLNAAYEKKQLKLLVRKLQVSDLDVVVNFNYDYYFLRSLFLKNRIITIINDDFWSRALFGYSRPLLWALSKTVAISSRVLTVSLPLKNKLQEISQVELFYPWADTSYQRPEDSLSRNDILFWGYINNRLDVDFLSRLSDELLLSKSGVNILLVGPQQGSSGWLKKIKKSSNIQFFPPTKLTDINLSRVFVGLMPYRSNLPGTKVAGLPNKSLQLLSKGLPLAVTGMPNFIQEPFVYHLPQDSVLAVNELLRIRRDFSLLQPAIQKFVGENSASSRLAQFMANI